MLTMMAFSQTYNVGQTNTNVSTALENALAQSDSNTVYRNAIITKLNKSDSTIYLTPSDANAAYEPAGITESDISDLQSYLLSSNIQLFIDSVYKSNDTIYFVQEDGTTLFVEDSSGGSTASLADIGDVDAYSSIASGDLIEWDGNSWINKDKSEMGILTATDADTLNYTATEIDAGIALANTALQANETITLSGDASGSGTTAITVTVADDSHDHTTTITGKSANVSDGDLGDVTISSGSWAVEDDSHNHIVSNIDGLQDSIDALQATDATKAPTANPTFTGAITHAGIKIQTHTITTDSTLAAALCYGGVFYVTEAQTITLPAIASGMSLTFITVGAVAVSIDVNASDKMWLDGTALADGDKATNTSTTGDIIVFTYYSADGWYAASGSNDGDLWTDGN